MKSLQDDQPTGFSKLCGLFSIGLTIDFISISQYPEVKSSTFLLNQSWIPICCFFPIPRTNPTRSGWWLSLPLWKMMEFGPVGMMKFPTECKNTCSKPPTSVYIYIYPSYQYHTYIPYISSILFHDVPYIYILSYHGIPFATLVW